MRAGLFAALCVLASAACQRQETPKFSCQDLRGTYDRAFTEAVKAGAAREFERQDRHMREGQNAYLAMESQGCCKTAGACPALNVR